MSCHWWLMWLLICEWQHLRSDGEKTFFSLGPNCGQGHCARNSVHRPPWLSTHCLCHNLVAQGLVVKTCAAEIRTDMDRSILLEKVWKINLPVSKFKGPSLKVWCKRTAVTCPLAQISNVLNADIADVVCDLGELTCWHAGTDSHWCYYMLLYSIILYYIILYYIYVVILWCLVFHCHISLSYLLKSIL